MPQSIAKIYGHIIFSTKNRAPLIEKHVRDELGAYITGILRNHDTPVLITCAVKDHVHILCQLSKNHAVSDIVEKVKTGSSKWLKTKKGVPPDFHWQNGYGVFSVSPSKVDTTKAYIKNQEEHHRRKTFEEEFRQFLKQYSVDYDERHVWG